MQKNGILMRFISCTLALVLLLGTIPMGALRAGAVTITEYTTGEWKEIPGGTRITTKLLTCEEIRESIGNTNRFAGNLLIAYGDENQIALAKNGTLTSVNISRNQEGENFVFIPSVGQEYSVWSLEEAGWSNNGTIYLAGYFSTDVGGKAYYLTNTWSVQENRGYIELDYESANDTEAKVRYPDPATMYVYEVLEQTSGEGGNAALYSRDYTLEEADFGGVSDYLPTILGENYIYLSADNQTYEEGTDEKLSLQGALTAGKISYSLTLNGNEATAIDTVGTYTLAVTYSGGIELGNITVTVNSAPVSISVDPTSASLNVGETQQVTATVKNSDSAPVWSSSNPDIASVDENGLVTAVAAGNATITASVKDGESVLATATASVTVTEVPVPKLTASSNSVVIGQPVTLTVSIPDGTAIDHTIWNSSTSILNIYGQSVTQWETYQGTASATISPIVEGTTEITATVYGPGYHDQYATLHATITVTKPILTVEPATVVMKPYSNATVAVTISDDNGNTIPLTNYGSSLLSTDNNSVVNQTYLDANNGSITISNNQGTQGTANVTFYLKHGNTEITSVTVPVTVTDATYTVDITDDDASASDFALEINGTKALGVDVRDASGNPVQEAKVTWSSSNSNVAKVDENGNVTAVAPGEATITATYDGINDSVKVTVNQPTVTITLPETATVNKDSTVTLTPTVTVTAGGEAIEALPVIEWSSSDTSKATVNENGVVTGVAGGTATITAKVTKLTVGDVTFAVSGEFSDTTTVTVTEIPMVGFDLDNMPTEIVLDAKENKEITIPLKFAYSGIQDPGAVSVICQTVGNTSGTAFSSSYDAATQTLILTGTGKCEGTLTVEITSAAGVDGIEVDGNKKTYQVNFVVNDNSNVENGTLTLTDSSMTLICGQTAPMVGASSLMHGTYEVKDYTLSYEVTHKNFTIYGETKEIKAENEEVSDVVVTVTATYKYGGEEKTATATFTVNSIKYVSPYSLNLGADYDGIYEGTTFTVVPHVDLATKLDTLTPWTVRWVSSNPGVLSVVGGEHTYGGPLTADANGIQYIGNGKVTLKAESEGTATLTAYLVSVDGEEVLAVQDSITVKVNKTKMELDAGVFYEENVVTNVDHKNLDTTVTKDSLYDIEKMCAELLSTGNYELRIKDLHTFQKDSNGLDARVVAVVGDNHIDFSNVTLNVYDKTTGQLVLDKDTLLPVEIPAGMLTYYDVETANVGWIPVRVTFKDYFLEQYGTDNTNDDLYEYAEYPTGGSGKDGIVWMYVQEKPASINTTQVEFVDADGTIKNANVKLLVDNYRPWLGTQVSNYEELSAVNSPLQDTEDASAVLGDQLLLNIQFFYTYEEEEYQLSAAKVQDGGVYSWHFEGNTLVHHDGKSTEMNVWHYLNYKAKPLHVTSDNPAIGYLVVEWNKIKIGDTYRDLVSPVTVRIPIEIREDSVRIDNEVTYAVDHEGAWGGPDGYNYISWMGSGPLADSYRISSYGITYECDLPEDKYVVGVRTGKFGFTAQGDWHEEFRVSAPLGTSNVIPTLHSITRLNGTVLILDEGDRSTDLGYTLQLDKEILILRSSDSTLTEIPNSDTVKATIRDKNGVPITVEAKIEWTRRNPYYVTSDYFPDNSNTFEQKGEDVAAGQNGVSSLHTLTGQHVGVTYYTAQLMEVQAVDEDGNPLFEGGQPKMIDVSSYMIADYVIIDVVNATHREEMNVVIDYDKTIDIDIHEFVANEVGYDFIGFSDLEHSLRRHSYTDYGEVEIVGTDDAYYTPGAFVEDVDPFYVIFQHVEKNNETGADEYTWHHYLINVIPATVMYYETDGTVADEFSYNGDWTNAGSDVSVAAEDGSYEDVQDDYRSEERDGKEIYGYDSSYDYDAYLSNQSSMFVKGTTTAAEIVANNPSTSASFSFQGTGFDIIARTDMDQATLRVHVTKQGEDKPTKIVSVICKGTNELYQIPVISVKGLTYGKYTVEIMVYDAYDPWTALDQDTQNLFGEEVLNQLARGNEFYFDAIRIYDPVKDNAIAEAAYKSDGEYAQTITQIGKLLIDQKKFQEITEVQGAMGTGAVFMDSYTLSVGDKIQSGTGGFVTTTDVATYDKVGPNNEVYLGKGQGIAFILNTKGTVPASIQIGAKSITGAQVTLNAKLVSAGTTGDVASTSPYLTKSIQTSTGMYYELAEGQDLTDFFADGNKVYVVIWNDQDSVLSVTDIKFAYDTNVPGTVQLEYSAELAKVAAGLISGEAKDTYLQKNGNEWCYCDGSGQLIDTTGLVEITDGSIWYVVNGKVNFSYSGLYTFEGKQYAIRGGRVETELNGIAQRGEDWWYFTNGVVDTTFTGTAEYDGAEYTVTNGKVTDTSSTES